MGCTVHPTPERLGCSKYTPKVHPSVGCSSVILGCTFEGLGCSISISGFLGFSGNSSCYTPQWGVANHRFGGATPLSGGYSKLILASWGVAGVYQKLKFPEAKIWLLHPSVGCSMGGSILGPWGVAGCSATPHLGKVNEHPYPVPWLLL